MSNIFRPKLKLLSEIPVSEVLKKIASKPKDGMTQVDSLLGEFHENSILFGLLLFSLPIAVPLPYPPGFTTVASVPIILFSIQMLIDKDHVALPKRFANYEISNSKLKLISEKLIPIMQFIEKYTKPRVVIMRSVYCKQFIGFMSLLAAISICVPLPFTNAIPAFGISVMSLGLINKDGIIVIIGIIITTIGLAIACGAIAGAWIGVKYLLLKIF